MCLTKCSRPAIHFESWPGWQQKNTLIQKSKKALIQIACSKYMSENQYQYPEEFLVVGLIDMKLNFEFNDSRLHVHLSLFRRKHCKSHDTDLLSDLYILLPKWLFHLSNLLSGVAQIHWNFWISGLLKNRLKSVRETLQKATSGKMFTDLNFPYCCSSYTETKTINHNQLCEEICKTEPGCEMKSAKQRFGWRWQKSYPDKKKMGGRVHILIIVVDKIVCVLLQNVVFEADKGRSISDQERWKQSQLPGRVVFIQQLDSAAGEKWSAQLFPTYQVSRNTVTPQCSVYAHPAKSLAQKTHTL